jgi:hypothetical protein
MRGTEVAYHRNLAPFQGEPLVGTVPSAAGVPSDPYCGLRTSLIRYANQLEFDLAVVEAGKASLNGWLCSLIAALRSGWLFGGSRKRTRRIAQ